MSTTFATLVTPTPSPTSTSPPPASSSSAPNSSPPAVVNYYYVFVAIVLCIGALAGFFLWRRRRRRMLFGGTGRGVGAAQQAQFITLGVRRSAGDRYGPSAEGRLEGLNEEGEAPPPYVPKNDERVERGGESLPASRHGATHPPGYEDANREGEHRPGATNPTT